MRRTARRCAILLGAIGAATLVAGAGSPAQASSDGRASKAQGPPLLAFADDVSGDSEVKLIRADGSGLRQLTRNELNDVLPQGPAWSPDGRRLIYILVNRDGVGTFYVRDVSGSGLMRLGGMLSVFVWSPDGRKVVTQRRGGTRTVRVVDVESGARRELYDGFLYGLAWSPDARRIVFGADLYFGGPKVFVTRADGTGRTRLVRNGTAPAWSPDGRLIAFLRPRGERLATVHVVRPDGTGLRRLSAARVNPVDPWEWAPDGQRLAISQYLSRSGRSRLGVMDADSGGVRWIYTTRERAFGVAFEWTPDAQRVAYSCGRGSHYDVCLTDVSTGRTRKARLPDLTSEWELSPDGKWVAFTGHRGVYVTSALGGIPRRVTAKGWFRSWSPDGRWILFQDGPNFYAVALQGASAKHVAQTHEVPVWQPGP